MRQLEKTQRGNAPGKSLRLRETTLREVNEMAETCDCTFSEVARDLIDGALEMLHDPKQRTLPTPLLRLRQRLSDPPRTVDAPKMAASVDMTTLEARVTAGVLAALQRAGAEGPQAGSSTEGVFHVGQGEDGPPAGKEKLLVPRNRSDRVGRKAMQQVRKVALCLRASSVVVADSATEAGSRGDHFKFVARVEGDTEMGAGCRHRGEGVL